MGLGILDLVDVDGGSALGGLRAKADNLGVGKDMTGEDTDFNL